MVRTRVSTVVRAATVVVLAALAGSCSYFTSPISGFLNGVQRSVSLDLDPIIGSADPSDVRYDLAFVDGSSQKYLMLVVEPPADPDTYVFNHRAIVMDTDMNELYRLKPASTIEYFSQPYGFGHTGELVVGYSVFDLSTSTPTRQIDPSKGLEGFITVDSYPSTDQFAIPSGRFSSYYLEIRRYYLATWGVFPGAETVDIVPDGVDLTDDPDNEQLGYQLLGIAQDGTDIMFLLSQPSKQIVVGAKAKLADVLDGTTTVLLPTTASELFRINADRPQASVDSQGFFLLRRDGWFERYTWNTDGTPAARVTGDTSFTRSYAFDVSDDVFYRFDSQTYSLTRIGGWW